MIKRAFSILTNKTRVNWWKKLEKYPFSMLKNYTFQELADFELSLEDFELFWYSKLTLWEYKKIVI
jgi:hypothetical protein